MVAPGTIAKQKQNAIDAPRTIAKQGTPEMAAPGHNKVTVESEPNIILIPHPSTAAELLQTQGNDTAKSLGQAVDTMHDNVAIEVEEPDFPNRFIQVSIVVAMVAITYVLVFKLKWGDHRGAKKQRYRKVALRMAELEAAATGGPVVVEASSAEERTAAP